MTSQTNVAPQANQTLPVSRDFLENVAYADGIAGLQITNGVAQLDFFQQLPVQKEGQAAQRVITRRLVLPVSAIPQLLGALKALDEKVKAARSVQ